MRSLRFLGVDIDGVVADTPTLAWTLLAAAAGMDPDAVDRSKYAFHEALGMQEAECKRLWAAVRERVYRDAAPMAGARDTLNELVRRGVRVAYVSSRGDVSAGETLHWLTRHGFPVPPQAELYQAVEDKGTLARKLGLDAVVEDSPDHAARVAEQGIPVLLMDRPYNRNLRLPGIIRVRDWAMLKRLLLMAAAKPERSCAVARDAEKRPGSGDSRGKCSAAPAAPAAAALKALSL